MHARHVDLLDEILVKLASREYLAQGYTGVIVMEPPRHGKSELCSHYNPAWYLGHKPDDRIILASYEADFAASWGGKTRDTLTLWGEDIFDVRVSKKTAAQDRWDLEDHKGGMFTAGVGGAITGRGGDFLILDDPVKNSADAASETLRLKQKEWWRSTFRTRLEPDGVILVIGTRWHEDDLIGYLLQEMKEGDPDADQWIVVRLPAIAEEPDEDYPEPDPLHRFVGEPLFPERFPLPALRKLRSQGEYNWNALFQQRPAALEGGLFKREWFPVVPHPGGKFKRTVRRWDLAATEEKNQEDPDHTVGLLLGEHEDGLYYVLDVKRFRESPGKVLKTLKETAQRDKRSVRIRIEQEPGSSGKIVIWQIARGPLRGYAVRGIRSTGNKVLRAETIAAAAERGEVRLVRGTWNREFLREVSRFPNDAHDDQVDALSGAYEDLTRRAPGIWTA